MMHVAIDAEYLPILGSDSREEGLVSFLLVRVRVKRVERVMLYLRLCFICFLNQFQKRKKKKKKKNAGLLMKNPHNSDSSPVIYSKE